MSILNILHYPDQRLRNEALPVDVVNEEIKTLVRDMFETMYNAPGIGLAAPQLDISKRIIVIDVSEERNDPICLINPELLQQDGLMTIEEGCLSVPGIYETVERPDHIIVQGLDQDGNPVKFEETGLKAVCIQHEIDHLNGKLFVDYLSELKRQRIKKKLEKIRRRTL